MISPQFDFEVYALMSMRFRMNFSSQRPAFDAKLAAHGLTAADGERIREGVTAALGDEPYFFDNLRTLLAAPSAMHVGFTSVLWTEFDFCAIPNDDDGRFRAGYRHVRGEMPAVDGPRDVALWSTDVTTFARRFGPFFGGRRWPLVDPYFPAYREHQFDWGDRNYGAGFCWGLFMFAAQEWD